MRTICNVPFPPVGPRTTGGSPHPLPPQSSGPWDRALTGPPSCPAERHHRPHPSGGLPEKPRQARHRQNWIQRRSAGLGDVPRPAVLPGGRKNRGSGTTSPALRTHRRPSKTMPTMALHAFAPPTTLASRRGAPLRGLHQVFHTNSTRGSDIPDLPITSPSVEESLSKGARPRRMFPFRPCFGREFRRRAPG
jgi:hypothetical protein